MVKTIAWESGGGYITLSYTGVGNGNISVSSDANETSNDRQQYVSIATTNGSPQKAVNLLIKQKGKTYPAGTVFNFAYTGTVQEVTLPPGKYKLQCWGAQGGNSYQYNGIGSKGGYSEGVLTLTDAITLYIFVGGKGANGTNSTSVANGGWNGGGGSVGKSSYDSSGTYGISYPACGGGATDIATVTSNMSYSSYRTNRSGASLLSRCIVAGGGAGASARYTEESYTTTNEIKFVDVPSQPYSIYKVPDTNITFYYFLRDVPLQGNRTYYLHGDVPTEPIMGLKLTTITNIGEAEPPAKTVYNSKSIICDSDDYKYFNMFFYTEGNTTDLQISLNNAYIYYIESTTDTNTSSSKSNSSQQGGGTSGRGTSPGTQTSGGGEFGLGKNQTTTNYRYVSGAGGAGWYGGGSSYSDGETGNINRSGGGSGFVNIAANSASRPSGYTGLQLDSGTTKAGNVSFQSPTGGNETGHSGNGYARITVLNPDGSDPGGGSTGGSPSISWQTKSGTWNESSNASAADDIQFTCESPGSSNSTVLRCTFSGISSITFKCRYRGEDNYDYLTVGALDTACTRSSYKTSLKGTTGTWKEITYTCDSGEHYVEFCYSKDGSVDTSPDNAEVYILEYS